MVQAFRHERNEETTGSFPLKGLDPAAHYEVVDMDVGTRETVSGKELLEQGVVVEIKGKPGAAILTYRKVK
jgi:hypothetical protein